MSRISRGSCGFILLLGSRKPGRDGQDACCLLAPVDSAIDASNELCHRFIRRTSLEFVICGLALVTTLAAEQIRGERLIRFKLILLTQNLTLTKARIEMRTVIKNSHITKVLKLEVTLSQTWKKLIVFHITVRIQVGNQCTSGLNLASTKERIIKVARN